MGNLTSLRIKREKVELDDSQSFKVRAISTNDIMTLAADHGASMAILFGKLTEAKETGELSGESVRDIIFDLAREFPDVAAAVISMAADEPTEEGLAFARDIPFTVQVDAIEKIFGLTFASEGAVKKLMESLTRMLMGVSGALTKTALPSENGIGE